MNWGIIGLGYMGKKFANSLYELDKNQLIGVSSNSFFRLIKFGFRHKIKFKYQFKDYEDILSCKDIDNIYIATINNTHHDLIIKCLEAKKNVLCEKPFVIDYEQAKNIKNKVEESKMLFLEALAYRSHPQIKKVISLINANSIGKILKINSSYGINKGKPKKNTRLFDKKLGGGSILDLGSYPVSISNLIANISNSQKDTIPEVKNVIGKIYDSEIDINAQAELFYKNGITSQIKVSISENLENMTTILGTDGKIVICDPWVPNKDSFLELHKDHKIKKIENNSNLNIFASQIYEFSKNIEKKNLECEYPLMTIDNSVDCMQVMTEWKKKVFEYENKKEY